jgi:hypothetical protein
MKAAPIYVNESRVDVETLTRFLNDVQRITGAKVTVRLRSKWIVETDNYPVSLALQTLLGGVPEYASTTRNKHKPDATQAAFKLSKKGEQLHREHTIKAWRLMDGETVIETLTVEERNKRLADGDFAEGAILHHPKAGKQRVIGAGPGQGMEPVK